MKILSQLCRVVLTISHEPVGARVRLAQNSIAGAVAIWVCLTVNAAVAQSDSTQLEIVPAATAEVAARPIVYAESDGVAPRLLPYKAVKTTVIAPEAATARDRIQILLITPGRPVLLEATVTIDGNPYHQARQHRVLQLASESSLPQPFGGTESDNRAEGSEQSQASQLASGASTEVLLPPLEEPPPEEEVAMLDMSPSARLARYATATGRTPSVEEIEWLLDQWTGPTLLCLNRNFERIRRAQAPAFEAIDRNSDNQVSQEELDSIRRSLLIADQNGDELVTFEELGVAADAKRRTLDPDQLGSMPPWDPPAPLIPLGEYRAAAIWLDRILAYYRSDPRSDDAWSKSVDSDGNGQISHEEYLRLTTSPAKIALDVSFHSEDPSASTVRLRTSGSESFATNEGNDKQLQFPLDEVVLEVQIATQQQSTEDRISLGAVFDGFPLLPHLDFDNDARLTLREMNQALEQIAKLDTDQDKTIDRSEAPMVMRLVIGRGPVAHRPLATMRRVHTPAESPSLKPPSWFVRNDRNRDGDISAKEFLGTDEQFSMLDTDGDELISAAEAVEAARRDEASEPKREKLNAK